MKILVFSDVHGSLNCLRALMETEDYKSADKLIFLGDIVMGCSRPNECIELIKEMNCICLLGNNDDYICNHVPDVDWLEFDDVKREQYKYMDKLVTEKNKKILRTWDRELYLNVCDKTLYFTHYAWRIYDGELDIERNPKEICLQSRKEMFGKINADYIFFGHEHGFNKFSDVDKHYYCLTTIGLEEPGSYLVLDVDKDVTIEERFVSYDIDEEIKLMDEANYPYSKDKLNTKVNNYNFSKFETYENKDQENKVRDFHKSRIAFLVLNGKIEILKESGMSHLEWAKSIGVDEADFNSIVRGYILGDTMVFYKGNFEYDKEVIEVSRKYSCLLKQMCCLEGKVKIYCGVEKRKPGEVWPPKLFITEI